MERTRQEIEKEIIKFLDEHSSKRADPSQSGSGLSFGTPCALGTSRDNMPRVTPIDFYNEGLTLWILGDPGEKLADIRSNPNVSVGIYTHTDRSKENRSIRLWGKASLVTYREQKELFMEVITRLGILDSFKKLVRSDFFEKIPLFESVRGEDYEARLDKLLNTETMIKVEPVEEKNEIRPNCGWRWTGGFDGSQDSSRRRFKGTLN